MSKAAKTTINDQITGVINKINDQNPVLVVLTAIGFILVVYYFIFLQGKIQETIALTSKIRDLRETLVTTKNDIQRSPQYKEQHSNLEKKIDSFNKMVKTKEEIPSALENLSRIAASKGVKIEQMMPDTARGETVLKNPEGKFIAIPIVIGARSSYHNFGRFMSAIEGEGIFSGISDFGLMTNPADSNQHLVKLVLKVIIFEKAEKVEKAEKAEKPKGKN